MALDDPVFLSLVGAFVVFFFFIFLLIRRTLVSFREGVERGRDR